VPDDYVAVRAAVSDLYIAAVTVLGALSCVATVKVFAVAEIAVAVSGADGADAELLR
jgi:uncharacterized membrane protein